jgi:hypothetical protein
MAERTLTPPDYVERVEQALRRQLPGADVRHEHLRADRYRFEVLWGGFDGLGHPERQQRVWDVVEHTLGPDDLLKVAMILTLATDDVPQE